MVDTAISGNDDDDDKDKDDDDEIDTGHKPAEKRRRSEPTATVRTSRPTGHREIRDTGQVKHRASDGNLPGKCHCLQLQMLISASSVPYRPCIKNINTVATLAVAV